MAARTAATKWKRKIVTYRKLAGHYPKFYVFEKILKDEADIIVDPVMTQLSGASAEPRVSKGMQHGWNKQMASLVTSSHVSDPSTQCDNTQRHISSLFCDKSNHSTVDYRMLAHRSTDADFVFHT